MEPLAKTYEPSAIESHWSDVWQQHNYSQPSGQGNPYCVILPPPNVTGSLHMGHGFQQTLMDILVRYHRMKGDNTLWQVGTDHAGIATQMVVERQLAASNISRHDLGREKFIDKVWQWKEQSGGTITNQMRTLGTSADWSRERFSMDDGLCDAVKNTFVKLHEQGLIYRGKRLVNWDPKFHTAISDLEVINKESQGHMWHIKYPLSNGSGHLIVATTRPETMLGDSAVAVHPHDERYQNLIGETIKLPLTEREIPIIADEYVDPEFGSGCVKITPAHDFNDYEVGKRHQLPLINIMTIDAHLNDDVPEAYRGLERFAARKKVVADLEALDLMEKIDNHTLQVPYGDRSDVVIEPLLTDQWYVKATEMVQPAIDAVKNGELQFIPENWGKTYLQWLENIQDWCISRQLWWGHRIPAWYDDEGEVYVGLDEADVRSKYKITDEVTLTQDEDVLDTWFSASLWPFATLGWPEKTPELETFYPTSVLVTGFDIIFFWVARMVMMGMHFMGKVPFKQVYITGLIRDSHGHKMSKSKGNVLDPLDVINGIELDPLLEKRTAAMMQPQMIEKIKKQTRKEFPEGIAAYGTDALRFTYCALANTGRNISFDMGRVEGYRNFCNKIWNASRFVMMNIEGHSLHEASHDDLSLADRWIISEMQHTINKLEKAITEYRFDRVANTIYEFIWNEYCDWYVEMAKVTLYDDNATEAAKNATRHTLVSILEQVMRLAHPIMPFITEAIWQQLKDLLGINGDSIMIQPFPQVDESLIDIAAEKNINWLKQLITAIRNVRGEMNVAPSKQIDIICKHCSNDDCHCLEHCHDLICSLARVASISQSDKEIPASASSRIGDMELHIPLANLIDKDDELKRLQKEIDKLNKDITKYSNKLNNANYTEKAPAAVVEKERERLAQAEKDLTHVHEQVEKISAL
ncbi:MAG: valine--tRNA ligase [Coxiellaceae bacterium]|nr:valine--tRNA ligase [Coxiellaceae bacterium]